MFPTVQRCLFISCLLCLVIRDLLTALLANCVLFRAHIFSSYLHCYVFINCSQSLCSCHQGGLLRIYNLINGQSIMLLVVIIYRKEGVLLVQELQLSQQEAMLWQRDRATRLSVEIVQQQNIPFKTRVPGLSYGIICMILRLAVFIQYRSVTDTHRQTDGRTDTRRRHVPRLQ